MKRLVTGAHGFVASHLARALLERGDAVTVLDLAPPRLSGLALQGIEPEVESVEADLRDAHRSGRRWRRASSTSSSTSPRRRWSGWRRTDPDRTFEANVRGTWTLLEACRRADVPAVVVASSDKAYGPHEQLPYREDFPLRPASPYEASKAAADAIALSYAPPTACRWRSPASPTSMAAATSTSPAHPRGDRRRAGGPPAGDPLRRQPPARLPLRRRRGRRLPGDRARGRAGGPAAGEAFNAGGERPHSVAEVLEEIAEVAGGGLEPEYHGTGSPAGEIDRQYVDSAKLRALTGWRPEVELRDGLRRTLEWYRANPEARP